MQVVQCDDCGGRVVYDAQREAAQCVFCGSVVLPADDHDEAPLRPEAVIPFEVGPLQAQRMFRRWARSSWWHARPLLDRSVELSALMVPVWHFDASLETHWAGLVVAATSSGLRPRAGVEHVELGARVPASMGLRESELDALGPFREGATGSVDADVPHEVPVFSERAASERARSQLQDEHRRRIKRAHRLKRYRGGAYIRIRRARLLGVPVYIGGLRYRGRPWRLVINGQSGTVTGRAPLDRYKVAGAIIIAIGLVGVAIAWCGS